MSFIKVVIHCYRRRTRWQHWKNWSASNIEMTALQITWMQVLLPAILLLSLLLLLL